MRKTAYALPVMLTILVASARAVAQEAAADALFDSARTAMARHDFDRACEQFRASDKLDPAAGTELNLADCEEKRGHLASAWELFRTVEEKLNPSDERVTVAHGRAQALQARVPRLTLELAAGAPKSSSVRDGSVELGSATFGISLPVEPGSHELVVSAPGFAARSVPDSARRRRGSLSSRFSGRCAEPSGAAARRACFERPCSSRAVYRQRLEPPHVRLCTGWRWGRGARRGGAHERHGGQQEECGRRRLPGGQVVHERGSGRSARGANARNRIERRLAGWGCGSWSGRLLPAHERPELAAEHGRCTAAQPRRWTTVAQQELVACSGGAWRLLGCLPV